MSDSVGKISLDIDLRADLNKQISHISGNIGNQLSKTLKQHVSGSMNGMKKLMPKFEMPKKSFSMPKKTYSTAKTSDANAEGNNALDSVLSNTNAKIDIQKQKLADLKAEYAGGMSDKIKSQIEQLERVMQSSEGRIQALNSKLKDLKYSYENAVSPERKNKLLDQISKTEMQMSSLINKSDKANQSIIELESGFSKSKKNALLEKIVNTEASLLRLNKSADQTKSKMAQLEGGVSKAEKPVSRLGGTFNKTDKAARKTGNAFFFAGNRANNMASAFSQALTRMLRQVFIFAIMYKALHSFTNYMGSALRTNQQFMHSLGQIRTNLQVAFMPIYQAILPALNALMSALATVTAYIASFVNAIFGKTYKQSFQAAQGLNAARTAMEGYGSASKKAAKDAKKASLGLAAFDEINTLASNKDDSNPDAGGGTDSKIAPLIAPDIHTGLLDTKMAELLGSVKKLLEPTIDSLKNLWKAMDPFKAFVAKGAIDFYEYFLKPIGLWTFGEGLPRFFNILADGFKAVNWPAINEGLKGLWIALTPFAINVGKGLLWFMEFVLKPLGVWTLSDVVPRFLKILAAAITLVNNVINALKPLATWLFEIFLNPLAKWTGGIIVKLLDLIVNGLIAIGNWIKNNQKWFESITIVIGSFALAWGIVTGALKAWTVAVLAWNGVGAIATLVTTGFGAAVAFLTSPITLTIAALGALIAAGVLLYRNWDSVSAWLKKCWNGIKDTATTVFNWLANFFKKWGLTILAVIMGPMTTIALGIYKNWDSIKAYLTVLLNTLKSMFSTSFTAVKNGIIGAFETVKSKVTGIWEGIWGTIKSFINLIISGVNAMIKGMNKLSFKAPDWVPGDLGGKTFGISIPEIPKLARGGIVDQPTLAMVGEAGKEAVMPLENNTGWISNLAGQIAGQIGGNSDTGSRNEGMIAILQMILQAIKDQSGDTIVKIGNDVELARVIAKGMNKAQRISGKPLLDF